MVLEDTGRRSLARASTFFGWCYHIRDVLGVSPLFRDGDPGAVSCFVVAVSRQQYIIAFRTFEST
jgi:hypothetical protein